MRRFLDKFREIPRGVSIRSVFTREWVEAVQDSIIALSNGENISTEGGMTRNVGNGRVRLGSRPGFQPWGRSASKLPFEFLGLSKNADGAWQARVAPGVVNYTKLSYKGAFEDYEKGRYIRGVFPMINTGSGLVRIDDESKPGIPIGSKDTGALWLKCNQERCDGGGKEREEVILTERGEKPDRDSGCNHILIVEFDIETKGSGATESKRATNIYSFLRSDWPQAYLCEGDDSDSEDDSIDSSWPFSDESDSDSLDLSDNSGSSDGDSDEPEDCEVRMTAEWLNRKDCFPANTSVFAASFCVPMEFIFEIKVKFWFKNNFGGVPCQKYAFGVKFPGGVTVGDEAGATADEYRWQNDSERTLKFKVANPAACQFVSLPWRMKSFPAASGFGGTTPENQGCCGITKEGSAPLQSASSTEGVKVRKLPQVCGSSCKCSGSSETSGSSDSGT